MQERQPKKNMPLYVDRRTFDMVNHVSLRDGKPKAAVLREALKFYEERNTPSFSKIGLSEKHEKLLMMVSAYDRISAQETINNFLNDNLGNYLQVRFDQITAALVPEKNHTD